MHRNLFLAGLAAIVLAGCAYPRPSEPLYREARQGGPLRLVSETTLTGFAFPESVGCDDREGVLYVSNFGGTQPKSAEKDGQGYMMKITPDGRVLEQRAFDVTMNKPKGIWMMGTRLWVTDIDSVWIFDTASKKSRKLAIPGITFANDPAILGDALYVSDNRADALFRIEPADFLDAGVQPQITQVWSKKDINPNGLWPMRDGSLLMVGLQGAERQRGIYAMAPDGSIRTIVQPFGRLDGLYQLPDGSILFTDWATGSLNHWSLGGGLVQLAKDFKGPADFCVLRDTVYVPDLQKNEIRVVKLTR
jgi:sugar lactone lactonase YvrE